MFAIIILVMAIIGICLYVNLSHPRNIMTQEEMELYQKNIYLHMDEEIKKYEKKMDEYYKKCTNEKDEMNKIYENNKIIYQNILKKLKKYEDFSNLIDIEKRKEKNG